MGFIFQKNDLEAVINCVPDIIERILKQIKNKVEKYDSEQYKIKEAKQEQELQMNQFVKIWIKA